MYMTFIEVMPKNIGLVLKHIFRANLNWLLCCYSVIHIHVLLIHIGGYRKKNVIRYSISQSEQKQSDRTPIIGCIMCQDM